jgi:hypothetical protein
MYEIIWTTVIKDLLNLTHENPIVEERIELTKLHWHDSFKKSLQRASRPFQISFALKQKNDLDKKNAKSEALRLKRQTDDEAIILTRQMYNKLLASSKSNTTNNKKTPQKKTPTQTTPPKKTKNQDFQQRQGKKSKNKRSGKDRR